MEVKVSVIIPVYNVEKYLRECIDSILNQTLHELELICVDDGSTDGSLEILQAYEKKDNRVTVLTQHNQGAGAARNKGLQIAKGEYLSFLDADDFLHRVCLKKRIENVNQLVLMFVYIRFYGMMIPPRKPGLIKDHFEKNLHRIKRCFHIRICRITFWILFRTGHGISSSVMNWLKNMILNFRKYSGQMTYFL